jgi:hypothetical protein
MPWSPADAPRHDKAADTSKKRTVWARVADSVLAKTGDDGRAAHTANGVLKKLAERGKHV